MSAPILVRHLGPADDDQWRMLVQLDLAFREEMASPLVSRATSY